jgi:hypothetical protein
MPVQWNTPFIPFDFRILMPHHLGQTDMEGGAYTREGKSYSRLWIHAIHEGTLTRFWENDDGNTSFQVNAETARVWPFPGEEYAVLNNAQNPDAIDITRPLTNELPASSIGPILYFGGAGSSPWDEQDDSRSLFWGVQALPAKERKLAARGLTIEFDVQYCAEKVRFLGWGGEFGPGPHNQYYTDPQRPFTDIVLPTS